MSIKVSVIIPAYNANEYIEETLDSLVNQTLDKDLYEVIVIEDGSKDKCEEICNKYIKEYKNFKYYYKDNSGVSDTRNYGIKKAKGEYILPLDSDDLISNNTLDLLVNFLDNHDEIDLAAYRDILFYEDGTKKERPVYKRKFYKGTGIYDVDKDDYFAAHQNMHIIFRNNKKHYYKPSLAFGEDEYLNTEIIMDKKKIGYVNEAIHYYRKHNNSCTSSNNKKDFDKIYDGYYEGLMEKYNNHPFIQTLIIHNVNWRMNEGFLQDKDLVNIRKKLEKVDFSLFGNEILFSTSTFYSIVALTDRKVEIKDNKYYIDGKYVEIDTNTYLYLNKITVDEKIHINCELTIPYFTDKNINVYYKYTIGKEEYIKKINPIKFSKYVDKFRKKFIIDLDKNVDSFEIFTKEIDNIIIKRRTLVPERKVYSDLNIIIGENKIYIKKRKIFSKLRNKFYKASDIKFLLYIILSMFVPKKNIYVGENNLIKELYEQDKKGYFVNNHTFKTKLYILNCNKMITNKKHNNLPFGKNNYKYIQAGQFDVITKE